ncbi:MAG: GntR family transcriptional regulator [Propionibacteriaceae bacterium]|nr:GntR family transcriptional regulator [Propionibacteriaceae bacterium]
MNDNQPVFEQVMEIIENGIINKTWQVDELIISTTQISRLYNVNPATAMKAISRLTERGILYKRPGIGMCVAQGALEKISAERRDVFLHQTIDAVLLEARTLGISLQDLIDELTTREGTHSHD